MLAGHGVAAVGEAAPGQQRPRDHRERVRVAGQLRPQGVEGNVQVMVNIGVSQGRRRMCDWRCLGRFIVSNRI